jgi:kinetochore protein Nuf2
MAEHLKANEAELNELLAEYWKLRHNTGKPHQVTESISLTCLSDVYMETLANKLNMKVDFT